MNPLRAKFACYLPLDQSDQRLLDRLSDAPQRRIQARHDLIREGDPVRWLKLVVDGWGCRYKVMPDGRRQIVALLLPGDFCNPDALTVEAMDHAIAAVGDMTCALVEPDLFDTVTLASQALRRALAFDSCAMLGMQREWTVNLAARPARQRIGHVLCELYHRLDALGMVADRTFVAPLTQIDLAEATGLTPVHVNRVVQYWRSLDLLHWHGRTITLPDAPLLAQQCDFDPLYLHMPRFAGGVHGGARR